MEKHFFLFLIYFLSISFGWTQNAKQKISTKIEKVTVFINGAQITRTAKINISPGKTELTFADLSPYLNKQSIQVKSEGKLTVLSVIYQLNVLKEQEKREEIKKLDEQKEQIVEKVNYEKALLNVYKQEEAMLEKNQKVSGDNNGLKTVDLKEAMEFQRQKLTEILQEKVELEKNIKKLELELNKINLQFKALNEKKDLSTGEVLVTVLAKEASNANFTLIYTVSNALWFPTYDIRVKDISNPILLAYKANIQQSSGED